MPAEHEDRSAPARRLLVVDSDGGVDDAVALWWVLAQPDVELVSLVATGGITGLDAAAANLARVLHAAGRPAVPVARGTGDAAGRSGRAHGSDGLGGHARRWSTGGIVPVAEPGADLLARLTAERPGRIELVTIGPLSTLAAALRDDPGIAGRLRSLTVMGGALVGRGGRLSAGETNVRLDPAGAAEVLAARWATAAPPSLVGLDVTLATPLGPAEVAASARGRSAAARFVADPLAHYTRSYAGTATVPPGGVPCHDLLAVMVALRPEVVTEAVAVRPSLDGRPGGTVWRVARRADGARLRAGFRALVGVPDDDRPGGG